jgi:two-component system OmpR family response regulator
MVQETILVIDDNAAIRTAIRTALEQNGYSVFAAADGQAALAILRAKKVATVLLDLVLPDADGLDLIAQIRKLTEAPIIIISGKGTLIDKVVGLEMGADDYLGKPFEVQELNARVRASVRRYKSQLDAARMKASAPLARVRFAGRVLDEAKCQAFDAAGRSCNLTASEFRLLLAFVKSPNRVLTRALILDVVRHDSPNTNDRAIDIQIGRLRKKLGDDAKNPQIIKTVRYMGYMFSCETETLSD